jgi:uncharacterized membrane protein
MLSGRALRAFMNAKRDHPGTTTSSAPRRMGRIANYLVAGILLTAPLAITLWLAWGVLSFVDRRVTPLIPDRYDPANYLPFAIPGLGLVLALGLLVIIGWFATGVAGRMLMRAGEAALNKVPILRGIYGALKQIFETLLAERSAAFRQVVMLEFPRRGVWSLGFLTGATTGEVQAMLEDRVLSVFVPATPNPTSGFLLFVPEQDARVLEMSVDEGLALIISGGIVVPDDLRNGAATAPPKPGARHTPGALAHLRNYLIAGVLVTAPIGITLWIAWGVITALDASIEPLIPPVWHPETYLPFGIPGVGLILLAALMIAVGFVGTGLLGRIITRTVEAPLARVPVLRSVYGATKKVFEALLTRRESRAFREVCLIEYPREGLWTLGFVTGVTRGEVQDLTEDEVLNVFFATTPNPTTGYLLFLPREKVRPLTMSVEDGIKLVVSGGLVMPPWPAKPERAPAEAVAQPAE